ncbi:MAG: PLP-dependent cysteine synthase family protein [Spirochaetia bacterium]
MAAPAANRVTPGVGKTPIESIGSTHLLRLAGIGRDLPEEVQLLAKAEWMNPGGSVKDRPAARMILDGERRGLLGPGRTIIDATSGNTGVAYAMIGAARGYPVKLCVPANTEDGILATLRAYGAQLILTDPAQGMDGATRETQRILAASPEEYFFPDQLNNDSNWKAHYEGTANEIWHQTGGGVTHFVAGVGTGGTLVGTGRRLRELNRDTAIVCVQPSSPLHGLEGLRHLATAIVPRIYDAGLVDATVAVETESAQAMVVRLARDEGIFVGVSAGAAVAAALQVASRLDSGVVVTVLPEGGRRFVHEPFWEGA